MIDRRRFIGCAAAGLLGSPFGVLAQQPGRIYRLGVLSQGARPTLDSGLTQLIATHLREAGFVDGQNLVVDSRFGEGRPGRVLELARELAQSKPDVIAAIGTSAIQAGKLATTTIPIVFLTNGDPIAMGLVPSLARPGGNITGILIAPGGSLAGKKLELLRELVPKARRIAFLVPDDPDTGFRRQREEVQEAAVALGVELIVGFVKGGDYAGAFATIGASRPAGLLVGAHSSFLRERRQIIALAARYKLPAIYEWPQHVKDGGLMSYGASDTETYRRVAVYVERILKGAKPSELPIEQPSKLLFVFNRTTAKALGIATPQSLLLRADEVIE